MLLILKHLIMALTSKNVCVYITAIFIAQSTVTSCANIDYLDQTLRYHFADTRNDSVYKVGATSFIYKEFQKFGLDTDIQEYTVEKENGQIRIGFNVVGVLKGVNFGKISDRILGIVAHYDTVSDTKGVDENGSGVAAMLEVARQIHEEKFTPEYTVIYLASDVNSYQFIHEWLPSWRQKHYNDNSISEGYIVLDSVMNYDTTQKSQIVVQEVLPVYQKYFPTAVNNIKSDGFKGDFISLIYRETPDSELADNFRHAWEAEGRPRFEIESFPLPLNKISTKDIINPYFADFLRSDHTAFWTADIPAVFITDTAEMRGVMAQCYQKMCDNVENLITEDNLRFLGKTADTIVGTIKHNGVPWNISDQSTHSVPRNSGNQNIHSSITMALALSSIIALLRFI